MMLLLMLVVPLKHNTHATLHSVCTAVVGHKTTLKTKMTTTMVMMILFDIALVIQNVFVFLFSVTHDGDVIIFIVYLSFCVHLFIRLYLPVRKKIII
jgi:hypothetical protein